MLLCEKGNLLSKPVWILGLGPLKELPLSYDNTMSCYNNIDCYSLNTFLIFTKERINSINESILY